MVKSVYRNILSTLIVWIILGGIQGHPSRRSEDQRAVEHSARTAEAPEPNRNEHQLPGHRVRESLSVGYESRHSVSNVRQNTGSDGKIVFPSELPYIVPQNYTPPPTAVCTNSTFCENPPHYPSDFIKTAIKSRHDLKYLATIDTVPVIDQRIDTDGDMALCLFKDTVIFPKSAQNKNNEWHYIVNEEDFPQGVRIEECKSENTACSLIEGFSDGYKTSCKQKYVYRQLAAVTPNGSLDKDYFRFAASCCCHVKFTGNAATRFGAIVGAKQNSQSPAPRATVASGDDGASRKK